jgi:hypothetical protein
MINNLQLSLDDEGFSRLTRDKFINSELNINNLEQVFNFPVSLN